MTALACTRCGADVLLARNSRVLEPRPSLDGMYDSNSGELLHDPDGAGHEQHRCTQQQEVGR